MSAFIVSPLHIQQIMLSARRLASGSESHGMHVYRWPTCRDKDMQSRAFTWQEAANELMAENVRSVNVRYGENTKPAHVPLPLGSSIPYLSPIEAIKAIQCLEYQSCESDDWRGTYAFAILAHLTTRFILALPGYEEARAAIASARGVTA